MGGGQPGGLPHCTSACGTARCPTAGRRRCRPGRPRRTASRMRCPPARPPARCSPRSPPVLPELWGGSADLAESNNTTMEGEPSFIPAEHQTKMWPGGPYGRTLHFGIREHAMGAIINGITAPWRHPGLRRHVPGVQRLHAPAGPAGRADAAARRSSCGRTTRSASAATARPTSRSSTSPRCARSPASTSSARPTRTRPPRAGGRILEKTDGPAGIALSRQNLPVLDPAKVGRRRQGRLHPRGGWQRAGRGDHHGHRLRGVAGPAGAGRPRGRGHCRPGSSRCPAWNGSRRSPRPTVSRSCRRRSRRESASRPASSRAGASTSAKPARSCPSSTSAPAPRATCCSSSSASPQTAWSRPRTPRCEHAARLTDHLKRRPHVRPTRRTLRPGRIDLARRHQPRASAQRQPAGPGRHTSTSSGSPATRRSSRRPSRRATRTTSRCAT